MNISIGLSFQLPTAHILREIINKSRTCSIIQILLIFVAVMKKQAIVTVINDLYSDRRVDKTCRELVSSGFEVTLVGRMLPGSPPLDERPYHTYRMPMIFHSGVMMYLELQIRLFIWLISHKGHFFWANDLDTLLPCLLVAKIRSAPVIQDSHEYFTGVPELKHHPLKRKIWKKLEGFCYPKVDELITVNESIAGLFRKEYRRGVHVIRNVPEKISVKSKKSRDELGIPGEQHMLLLQGAGINVQRGAEELVQAMEFTENALLYIIGSGDVVPKLKQMAMAPELKDRIIFLDRMPYDELLQYTLQADLGFSLDKPLSLNYQLSLPNKIFDYIQCNTPVIVSKIKEVQQIVEKYDIGLVIDNHKPEHIAKAISSALNNKERYAQWKENLKFAAEKMNWENEKKVLQRLLSKYV